MLKIIKNIFTSFRPIGKCSLEIEEFAENLDELCEEYPKAEKYRGRIFNAFIDNNTDEMYSVVYDLIREM